MKKTGFFGVMEKKRGVKATKLSFFAGMLSMALLVGTVGTAFAAYQKQATLSYQDIKITLNGEPVEPKDGAGNVVEPFAMDGTTYLPVRAIANALGLEVNWDGATNTVALTSGEKETSVYEKWGNQEIHDCYPGFSIPSFENVVGMNALIDIYPLSAGDSVAYTYNPALFEVEEGANCFDEYFNLLSLYGYERMESDDSTVTYKCKQSGLTVAMYWNYENDTFTVLLMSVPEKSSAYMENLPAENYSQTDTITRSCDFPLHLYSNDGKVYLGKMVTSKYDSDGLWNTYGDYGNKYNSDTIWNEYGTYGSKYSNESAFNKYASKPPKIVDDNGNFFGYLTVNSSIQDGYTIEQISRYLENNGQ